MLTFLRPVEAFLPGTLVKVYPRTACLSYASFNLISGCNTDQSLVRRIVMISPLRGGRKPSVVNTFTECKKRRVSPFLLQLHPHQYGPSFADYSSQEPFEHF